MDADTNDHETVAELEASIDLLRLRQRWADRWSERVRVRMSARTCGALGRPAGHERL